jgi:hypothetical protein
MDSSEIYIYIYIIASLIQKKHFGFKKQKERHWQHKESWRRKEDFLWWTVNCIWKSRRLNANNCFFTVSYLTRLFQHRDYMARDGVTDGWWTGKYLAGSSCGLIVYYPEICWEGLRKIPREISVKIGIVLAKIRTEHLQNSNLELCLYAILLGANNSQIMCSA